jgi:homoserine dehydrogenase
LILTEMEHGNSFEAAVGKAQDLGIAETDPSFDVDGWDATVKVSALATVLTLAHLGSRRRCGPALAAVASAGVDYPLKPNDIAREGIRGLGMEQVQSARTTLAPAIAAVAPSPAVRWAGSAGVGPPIS